MNVLHLAVLLYCAGPCFGGNVALFFDTNAALQRPDLTHEYLSVNIDSSSLAKGFDFADPVLGNLVRQLSPVLLRIGGTASNALVWTGAEGGLPCGSGNGTGVMLSAACFDTILSFLNYTGARLLFDFAPTRSADGSWNTSSAVGLMTHVAARGAGALIGAWQLGNEDPGVTSGSQMGADFLTAKALASNLGLPDAIIGPSAGGTPAAWMDAFCNATYGKLSMWSAHTYGGVNCSDVSGGSFVQRKTYYDFVHQLHGYVQQRETSMAPSTGLLVEETASAPIGGCVNASDRFIDGFYWLTVAGLAGEYNVTQINRQDIAGWSFLGMPSHYALAGPPGWTNGSAALVPHADYYTTVLFKQLMGVRVLNFTWSGSAYPLPETGSNVTLHAYCSATASGGVTVAYVIGAGDDYELIVPTLVSATPRTEYFLTSSAASYSERAANRGVPDAPLPLSLWDDAVFLNGVRMTVDSQGRLPVYPIPGHRVTSPQSIVLPGYSYGFIDFTGANVPACL